MISIEMLAKIRRMYFRDKLSLHQIGSIPVVHLLAGLAVQMERMFTKINTYQR
ncbi:hypothetical protein [Pseudomonas savastanoi]|uniref:Uncharacterized protein n=1 Tax=Pseudomonas savastanoi TaxID=29438 RepID=A0A3M5ZMA5_PSESS|nr:hypothetical protein [Pseudomonas savastanoi]KPX01450.1 hypothetical protein ALO74_200070 [Pseudomonas syringae pv. cunninghamiae]RMV08227.1 hypothetical protein ALP16_200140 [Pseudomonas savastanoi]RMV13016.1 hypothetical protein ALP15_02508 [Pseudomonas savastanoi]